MKMNRQDKRKARVFALKMAYAYEMTNQKDSLIYDIYHLNLADFSKSFSYKMIRPLDLFSTIS